MQKGVALLVSFVLLTQLFAISYVMAETQADSENSVIIQGQVIAVASGSSSTSSAARPVASSTILQSTGVPATEVEGDLKVEVTTEAGQKVLTVKSASGAITTTIVKVSPQTAISAAEAATGLKCPPLSVVTSTTPAGAAARALAVRLGCKIAITTVPPRPTTVAPVPVAPSNPPATLPSPTASGTVPTGTVPTKVPVYTVTVPAKKRFSLFGWKLFPVTTQAQVNVDLTTGQVISMDEGFLARNGLAK